MGVLVNRTDRSLSETVCVQGLGFVGAAMAVAVASARNASGEPLFSVIGVDLPTALGSARVSTLNRGEFPFPTKDTRLIEALTAAHLRGNIRATTNEGAFATASVIVVDVHMDLDAQGDPPTVDFAPFRAAIRTVARHARPGTLIIIETTVPPGTCEHIVVPEVESCLRERGLPIDSLLLAHAYERVMPGDQYLASIVDYWRVYAGHTQAAAERCEAFLSKVVNAAKYPLMRLSSTTASETAKLMENSYRATNIAFVEEWARFAEAVGVNLFEVVTAIRMRPTHDNIRQPGFGVGGYCLTKDPLFASIGARVLYGRDDLTFPFSEQAVAVNAKMPLVALARLEAMLAGELSGKRVLLAGVAYRPDVGDTRYSPSEIFATAAIERGATIVAHDPLVTYWPELDVQIAAELPRADSVDAVVFAVAHREYTGLDIRRWLSGARPVILDANHVLGGGQRAAIIQAGCVFAAIGEG